MLLPVLISGLIRLFSLLVPLAFFALILLAVAGHLKPTLRPFFPLAWRKDLYDPKLKVPSEAQFSKKLALIGLRKRTRTEPLEKGEPRGNFRRDEEEKKRSSAEGLSMEEREEEISVSSELLMAPHKKTAGTHFQEGEDRVYFVGRREVTENPFFRNEKE